MPIEFDNQRVDVSRVDDRRGGGFSGSTAAMGSGIGVVGVIVALVVQLLGGPNISSYLPALDSGGSAGTGTTESPTELQARCNSAGALQRDTDCRLIKIFDVADTVWSAEFARHHWSYASPRIAFFSQAANTGCGQATASVGPFYCPADQEIYFDLGFLDELQTRFGAQGQFAQAYIVAHEFGHHIQSLRGIEATVRAKQERYPDQANQLSVRMELQADCLAGVWGQLAAKDQQNGVAVSDANIAEAVNAAQAVGDDRIQQAVQGRIDPESWTHGSAAQREQWFLTGYRAGSLASCNTYA
jgi:hypothetical protein